MSRDSFNHGDVERLLMAAAPFVRAFENHKYGRGVSVKHWRDLFKACRELLNPSPGQDDA